MTYWDIRSGGDDLEIGTPVEIFNRGEPPGSPPNKSSEGDKVTVNFYSHEGDSGFISNATNQTITLALEKAGKIKLKLNTRELLISSISKMKHTEWIVV